MDQMEAAAGPAPARALALLAGTERSAAWRLRADRWGAFRVGPVTLRAHDPSALVLWSATCGGQQLRPAVAG